MPPVTTPRPGGVVSVITGTVPGAGVEYVETVPVGSQWELIAVRLKLVTSGSVANRSVQLAIDAGGAPDLAASAWDALIAASTTIKIYFSLGFSKPWNDQGGNAYAPLPRGLQLYAGWRLKTLTTNLQAGDQFSEIALIVK